MDKLPTPERQGNVIGLQDHFAAKQRKNERVRDVRMMEVEATIGRFNQASATLLRSLYGSPGSVRLGRALSAFETARTAVESLLSQEEMIRYEWKKRYDNAETALGRALEYAEKKQKRAS